MKTVLAALALTILTVAPAAAEASPTLRGSGKLTEPMATSKVEVAAPRSTETTPPKKVRVVLASPYGN